MLALWAQFTGDIDGYSGTIPAKLKGAREPLTDFHPEARFHDRVATAAIAHYNPGKYELECEHCGDVFYANRRDKLTCSGKCQKALQRSGKKPRGTSGVGRAANRAIPLPESKLESVHYWHEVEGGNNLLTIGRGCVRRILPG